MSGLLSFQFQSGVTRETVTVDAYDASLRDLRQEAVKFIAKHHPQHGMGDNLADHILLYRHDFRSVNILQLLMTSEDVSEGTLIEIVISPCPQHERLVVHPHTLYVHSYKTPTFCDFCGELLFGLVKQGLKCQGCRLNYHKRCASKIPNNCNGSRQRRPSAIPLSPRSSVGFQQQQGTYTPSGLLATVSNTSSYITPGGNGVAPNAFSAATPSMPAAPTPSPVPASPTASNAASLIIGSGGDGSATAPPILASTTSPPPSFTAALSSEQFSSTPRGSVSAASPNAVAVPPPPSSGTPDILVTSDQQLHSREDGDPIGGNFLQMPRKDRSSSWSGRPLWMEIAEATRVKVPHTFQVHSYKRPTVCQYCKKLLKGLIRQGIQCRDCKYNCHKKCAQFVAKDCAGSVQYGGGGGGVTQMGGDAVGVLRADDSADDSVSVSGISNATDYCSATLGGALTDASRSVSSASLAHRRKATQSTPSAPLHKSDSDATSKCGTAAVASPADEDDNASVNESQNIPLMRIVMSKKQTKRPTNKVIKEGWMVHYTDRHNMRKKHFWRLDTKSIVMYKDETSSGYYKEIPLSEVLEILTPSDLFSTPATPSSVDAAQQLLQQQSVAGAATNENHPPQPHAELRKELTHFFEIRTHLATYFIAGAPTDPAQTANATSSSAHRHQKSPAENAARWAAAIKQALMPVTPQSSQQSAAGTAAGGSCADHHHHNHHYRHGTSATHYRTDDMAQLKVPVPGETGHLGIQIQSEQEFSQHYQIFADEILGSGQFGTVYGGIQRKTGKHVAVKLIDKLKFPSNKEAALRTEVDILQKVRHPGVVEFQQMLETPDRIFVVMEKLKGDMLEMILSSERGRLSERITQFLVHQILIALRYLHNMNIVHCDLKPENILLTSDSDFPQVKLCDFGFARIIGERSFRRSVVGTPAYLAPEVLRNKGFNRSLDMWSVGVIVYVSLSGTFPFNEDEDINDQIQNADFMYPPNPWKEISANAVEFINSLLQVKMSKRLTVSKALSHIWLQSYDMWSDLRCLERDVGERFVTHESDDARWHDYEAANAITPIYN